MVLIFINITPGGLSCEGGVGGGRAHPQGQGLNMAKAVWNTQRDQTLLRLASGKCLCRARLMLTPDLGLGKVPMQAGRQKLPRLKLKSFRFRFYTVPEASERIEKIPSLVHTFFMTWKTVFDHTDSSQHTQTVREMYLIRRVPDWSSQSKIWDIINREAKKQVLRGAPMIWVLLRGLLLFPHDPWC